MEVTAQGKTRSGLDGKAIKVMPIMIALLLSGFIGMFSETALNVALTQLTEDLNVSYATIQWLTTGYLLVLGILVPVSGLLLQRFTTRQLFIAALVFISSGTFIAAIAPTFIVLLVGRIIQAVGTALLIPLMFNTILVVIPPERRGSAMGLIGLVMMSAPAIGPTIAGLIVEHLSWNWIFWISLPFLLFALGFGIKYMQNVSEVSKPKIDVLSILLSTLGFGGIVFGFSSAGEGAGEAGGGWENPVVIVSLIVGVIALILFSWRQMKMEKPMINLRVFKFRMFTIGLLMVFLAMMIILSSLVLLPVYLQRGLVVSVLATGLIMLPGGLINGAMSLVTGRLFDRFGPKWLVPIGLVIAAASLWFFSSVTTASSIGFVIALHACLMIGISMVMMPAQTNGLNQLPPEYYPDGTAIMNTLQQVAGAIGTALAISLMNSGIISFDGDPTSPLFASEALTHGVSHVFRFGAIIALVGLVVSFFIKRVNVGHQKGEAQAERLPH
ncbi:lincomycin resistance protein LmrB [Saccharibacillus kuerlensis]|uniref:Lincomycin resistance protein LmrB n=2 Tax=Saccharibacillus kuerlensis TaxID=459527 RepID=A0ABQ2L7V6_9BACL|nr:lincomycin resistance protein LmrB [Saccharibacillus kuerlensis]